MSSQNSGARRNRLAGEVSPYLLLHQTNPVDWYPWGEEALSRAREENKPIFLSVGYSTCYWCHVMERESFSDPEIAAQMNRDFINIKLDREERPDLDEIYMAATQLLTHHGGWPNSVFLTPGLMPYFAGTYFPPAPRQNMPSFHQVLESMAAAWRDRRDDVDAQAQELEQAMRRFLEERGTPAEEPPEAAVAVQSLDALATRFDTEWGGFAQAPKFPSPANLYLLLDLADEHSEADRMLSVTLDQMARGGIYDQLAGGFHRYATDREWKIPHFEKMLYDNGLLLEVYARQHARSGDSEMARVVRETAAFLEREMGAPEGGFWSAIDAETHGHEGAFYVWNLDEIEAVLGAEDAGFLATLYGYDRAPFFEGTSYVLHLPVPLPEQAQRRRMALEELLEQMAEPRARLLAARNERERPLIDDKVLTDWNGMVISGLAAAGCLLDEPSFVERAARAADFLEENLRGEDGVLLHSWRGGKAKNPAYLSDYVFLVKGLLELYEATADERWLDRAKGCTREQIERLGDSRGGFFVAGEQPDVLFRSREVFDGALPSTNGLAVLNLLELSRLDGDASWLEAARSALQAFAAMISGQPDGARMLALASRRYRQITGSSSAEGTTSRPKPASPLVDEAQRVVNLDLEIEGDTGWRPFSLAVAMADDWHIYGPEASDSLTRTELRIVGGELRDVSYPPTREVGGVQGYEGRIVITGELEVTDEAEGRLVLVCQPCDATRCLPAIELDVAVP